MLSSGLFPGSPKSLKIKIYMISVFRNNKYVVLKLWGQEEFWYSTLYYMDIHISERYSESLRCAVLSTIRGSWRRMGHCMWKAARNRHSTLGTSELLKFALVAQLLPQSPKGDNLVNIACVDAVWKTRVLYLPIRETFHFTGLDRNIGFQEVESSRFCRKSAYQDVSQLHLRTQTLNPPGHTPGTPFH
jgi:hypothetical protein